MISLHCKPTNPFSKQHKRDRKRSVKQSLAHSRSQDFIKQSPFQKARLANLTTLSLYLFQESCFFDQVIILSCINRQVVNKQTITLWNLVRIYCCVAYTVVLRSVASQERNGVTKSFHSYVLIRVHQKFKISGLHPFYLFSKLRSR